MPSDVRFKFNQLRKRMKELEQHCMKQQEEIRKLHLLHQQLNLRVNLLEQLIYQDYLYLREMYQEELSREGEHKRYLM